MFKKIPLPIVGVMLGITALGNLVQSYSNTIRLILALIALIIGILFSIKIMKYPSTFKEDMKNPVTASIFGTFPMAIILLSTYIEPYINVLSTTFYYLGVLLHIFLIIYFTINFIFKFNIRKVFASYYIVYVGIVVASVASPVVNNKLFGQACFWFGFFTFFPLLCIIGFRYYKLKEIPESLIHLFCITTAPASLLLAGYMKSFDNKNLNMVYFLLILSQILYLMVLVKLPKFLKTKFYPSYAAFTFPFVITTISLKLTNVFLIKIGKPVGFLKYIIIIETFLATILTLYALFSFYKSIISNNS